MHSSFVKLRCLLTKSVLDNTVFTFIIVAIVFGPQCLSRYAKAMVV